MKALVSTPTSEPPACVLSVADRPMPILRPSNILIRVYASGINPSDAANGLRNLFRSSKPNIPGRDFAGVVHESASPDRFPPGTEVFGTSGDALSFSQDGTAAEFVLVPEDAVVKKPRILSMPQAAAIGVPYTTALLAYDAAHLRKGVDTVLVLGATGAVGRAAICLANAWGCKVVTASRRNTTDANILKDPGLQRVKEILGGLGPNIVIDAVGSSDLLSVAMRIMQPRGRYALFAAFKGGSLEYKMNMLELYRDEKTICGVNSIAQSPRESGELIKRLAVMFEEKGLQPPSPSELVGVRLDEAAKSYEEAIKFDGTKRVIEFDRKVKPHLINMVSS
ncbi:MAG: Reticulon-4-interacting protein 1, mitochondrial [Bogoriella megaspora]|nr:MAG: Reticulon-4-interacting protein 1, mitochondrial [Bogoriella megaspora]